MLQFILSALIGPKFISFSVEIQNTVAIHKVFETITIIKPTLSVHFPHISEQEARNGSFGTHHCRKENHRRRSTFTIIALNTFAQRRHFLEWSQNHQSLEGEPRKGIECIRTITICTWSDFTNIQSLWKEQIKHNRNTRHKYFKPRSHNQPLVATVSW